jgi:hypothetical protein
MHSVRTVLERMADFLWQTGLDMILLNLRNLGFDLAAARGATLNQAGPNHADLWGVEYIPTTMPDGSFHY